MKTKTKAGRRAMYELMAKKVGDDSFGNTELLATVSLDELKTVERIAKALADDNSGRLLAILRTHMDFLERPAGVVSREVLLRAREMAARASKAKHPRACKAQQPDNPEGLVEIQKLYERGRALVKEIGADDRKTASQSGAAKMSGRGAWRGPLAAHEAAHAVMAFRFRQAIGPRGVWITRPGVGETDVGPLCKAKPPHNGRRREAWKCRARAEVISLLAGPVAEWMALGRPVNSKFRPRGADPDSDLRRVDRYLAELAGADGPGAEQWRLQERTKRLLCHPRTWRAILAVAEKLAEAGSVRGREAYAEFRANHVPRARRL